jgi:two-component system nitrate/nitrite response regulator NarL
MGPTGDERIRVVVVDDHPLYREGVVRALSWSGTIDVVAEVGTGREALEAIKEHDPDIALVDYRLPDLDGLAIIHAAVRDRVRTRIVMLSASRDSATVYRALEQGAAGYLAKDARREEIVAAVTRVAAGHTVVPAELVGGLADEIRLRGQADVPVLSDREQQVLRLFADGLSIPQVAEKLFLSPSTVKTHAQRLYQKLDVSDRAAAVAEAMRHGLLE